jgi:hypothetical protein
MNNDRFIDGVELIVVNRSTNRIVKLLDHTFVLGDELNFS